MQFKDFSRLWNPEKVCCMSRVFVLLIEHVTFFVFSCIHCHCGCAEFKLVALPHKIIIIVDVR